MKYLITGEFTKNCEYALCNPIYLCSLTLFRLFLCFHFSEMSWKTMASVENELFVFIISAQNRFSTFYSDVSKLKWRWKKFYQILFLLKHKQSFVKICHRVINIIKLIKAMCLPTNENKITFIKCTSAVYLHHTQDTTHV